MNHVLRVMRRATVCTAILVLGFSVSFAQDQMPPAIRPGYCITDTSLLAVKQSIANNKPSGSKGVEGVTSKLEEGIPASVSEYALAHQRESKKSSTALGALEGVLDRLYGKFNSNREQYSIDPEQSSLTTGDDETVLAAINRPALFLCNNMISDRVPTLWYRPLTQNKQTLEQLSRISRSVGLIRVNNPDGLDPSPIGTGFMAAKNVVLTNRHVAEQFINPDDGSLQWDTLKQGRHLVATINFCVEKCPRQDIVFNIRKALYIAPKSGMDVAILEIEIPAGTEVPPPLTLAISKPNKANPDTSSEASREVGRLVYVVGYPFDDPRLPPDLEYRVFGDPLGVKRVAFGMLQSRSGLGNKGLLAYDCSTSGGCSGSPLVDLATGTVWGLHFKGQFKKANFAVPIWKLIEDEKIARCLGLSDPANK